MGLVKSAMTADLVGVVLVAGLARETSAAPQMATSGALRVDDGTNGPQESGERGGWQ
jgi:hypothetical protein